LLKSLVFHEKYGKIPGWGKKGSHKMPAAIKAGNFK
jgi:hypothetical protein